MQSVNIVYGSKTDNAKKIALFIKDVLDLNFTCNIFDAKDYMKINFSKEQILILVTSTRQGKPPPNALSFLTWLKNRDSTTKFLSNLKVAVLGIGNITFEKYCQAGKDFEENLINHGATRLVTGPLGIRGIYGGPIGIANELTGFVEAETWIQHLEETLKKVGHDTEQRAAEGVVQEAVQYVVQYVVQRAAEKAIQCFIQENNTTRRAAPRRSTYHLLI
jgi:sulfite reductase alpha subunit-like flavoprotein